MHSPFLRNITRPFQSHPGAALILLILLISGVVLTAAWLDSPHPFDVDSHFYRDIAEGRISSVIKPFSYRILHPFITGLIASSLQLDTELSFLIVGILSLVILVTTVALIARSSIPYYGIAAILVTPFLLGLFQDYYLPDLFHAALLGLFLLCLVHEKHWLSLILLFALQITRESTVLLTVVLVVLSFSRKQWKLGLGSIFVTALGIAVTGHFASRGQSNIHEISNLLYLAAKIPYNFFKNLLGLVFWTNTFAVNNPARFPLEPMWQISLPGWVPSGAIHSVGFYTFDLSYPLITINLLLTTFGIMPALVLVYLSRMQKRLFTEGSLAISVALLYGLLSFVIGTSLGASVDRLIGYGWPCFWIACPFLLKQHHHDDRKFIIMFFLINLLAAWLPMLVGSFSSRSALLSIPVLCVSLIFHGFAWKGTIRSRIDRT